MPVWVRLLRIKKRRPIKVKFLAAASSCMHICEVEQDPTGKGRNRARDLNIDRWCPCVFDNPRRVPPTPLLVLFRTDGELSFNPVPGRKVVDGSTKYISEGAFSRFLEQVRLTLRLSSRIPP